MEEQKIKLKPMVRLSKEQIEQKKLFVKHYMNAENAATGSLVDPNSNVTSKNVATLQGELFKDMSIQINRSDLVDYIKEYFDQDTADLYNDLLESHVLYKHDETSVTPTYCAGITIYPFLEHGMVPLGGEAKAPKHIWSFAGSFVNLMFALSTNFAGAIATPEFFLCIDHFARKDWGEDYLETHKKELSDILQQIIFCINQPTAMRSYQSIFWNLSIFDEYFFESVFHGFMFPDGSMANYQSLRKLQFYFLEWFLEQRKHSLLTFPVLTESSLNDKDGNPKDMEFAEKIAESRANGLSFFSYNNENAAAISSCCRLKNSIVDEDGKNEHAYTLGNVGVKVGSTSVMTINLNRIFQTALKDCVSQFSERSGHRTVHKYIADFPEKAEECVFKAVELLVKNVHKFQYAHRQMVEDYIKANMLPAYTAGFIDTKSQFCTIGINGLNEACEYMGYTCNNNDAYKGFVSRLLSLIANLNKEARKIYKIKFNTELVPGESLGIKNYNWDKKDGLEVPEHRNCYNSYIYLPEDSEISIPDKFQLHGAPFSESIDGGSALHLNISQLPDKEFFLWLRKLAGKYKCDYWTVNVLETMCEDCGRNDFRTLDECPVCHSHNISYASRVIGYLKKIENYSKGRQIEAAKRFYH